MRARVLLSIAMAGALIAVPQQVTHPADALGVETVDRLVEEQHAGIAQQGRGDTEALAHTKRELSRPSASDRAQSDLVDDLKTALG